MENNSQNSDIEIRTMKSDIAAVKASGGDATSMQFIKLSKDKKPVAVEETKINIRCRDMSARNREFLRLLEK